MTPKTFQRCFLTSFLLAVLCMTLVRSFTITRVDSNVRFSLGRLSMSSLFVSSSDDIKGLVARSDMILIVPTSTVRTDYISGNRFLYHPAD